MTDLWVFGYGSLMWRPGFTFAEARPARLHGAHRALCVWSVAHRGTPAHPGLVLGLDRGGSCRGVAFRITPESGDSVMAYLRQRELIRRAHAARKRPFRLARMVGWGVLWRLWRGRLTLAEAEAALTRVFGASVRAVVTEHAELGADVDRAADLEAMGQHLEQRG